MLITSSYIHILIYYIKNKHKIHRKNEVVGLEVFEKPRWFQKRRSGSQQTFNLKKNTHTSKNYCKQRNIQYATTFIDFHKAYDSMDSKSMITVLRELGLDTKTTN